MPLGVLPDPVPGLSRLTDYSHNGSTNPQVPILSDRPQYHRIDVTFMP